MRLEFRFGRGRLGKSVGRAIGTETNGSIICPAVTNGVVGIKPTLGLVSRSGIIPIAHTQDTAGPMARTVTDAAIMLGAMAGSDKMDPATAEADKKAAKDYTKFLDAGGLKGRAARRCDAVHDAARAKGVLPAVSRRYSLGRCDAGRCRVHARLRQDRDRADDVLLYEFKTDLNKYLAARGAKYKTLDGPDQI